MKELFGLIVFLTGLFVALGALYLLNPYVGLTALGVAFMLWGVKLCD